MTPGKMISKTYPILIFLLKMKGSASLRCHCDRTSGQQLHCSISEHKSCPVLIIPDCICKFRLVVLLWGIMFWQYDQVWALKKLYRNAKKVDD